MKLLIQLSIFILLFFINKISAQCYHQVTTSDTKTVINDSFDLVQADQTLIMVLSSHYGVKPIVKYYNDLNAANAIAYKSNCKECISSYGKNPDGYVFLGKQLMREVSKTSDGIVFGKLFIMAHELAHIKFFNMDKKGEISKLFNVKEFELYADFLSGYVLYNFFKSTSENKKKWLDLFIKFVYESGDTEFNNPNHHGTKTERILAFAKGYNLAKNSINIDISLEGLRYILKIKGERIKK